MYRSMPGIPVLHGLSGMGRYHESKMLPACVSVFSFSDHGCAMSPLYTVRSGRTLALGSCAVSKAIAAGNNLVVIRPVAVYM